MGLRKWTTTGRCIISPARDAPEHGEPHWRQALAGTCHRPAHSEDLDLVLRDGPERGAAAAGQLHRARPLRAGAPPEQRARQRGHGRGRLGQRLRAAREPPRYAACSGITFPRVTSMGGPPTQGACVSILLQQAEGTPHNSSLVAWQQNQGKRGGRCSLRGMSCSSRRKHSHSPSTAVMAIAPTFTSHLREPPTSQARTLGRCMLHRQVQGGRMRTPCDRRGEAADDRHDSQVYQVQRG